MKKIFFTFILFLCTFLAACGGEPEISDVSITETKDLVFDESFSFDIFSQAEELFRFEVNEQEHYFEFLGMQYYEGEPVQLWMEILDAEGNPKRHGFNVRQLMDQGTYVMDEVTANIYLYRADQSRELVVAGLPSNDTHVPYSDFYTIEGAFSVNRIQDYINSGWYVDQNGCCYCWWISAEGNDGVYTFLKMDSSGNILYEVLLDTMLSVRSILELPDGATYVMLNDYEQNAIKISEFNPDTGELSKDEVSVRTPEGKLYPLSLYCVFGVSEEGSIYSLTSNGIYRLELSDGKLAETLAFIGSTYVSGDSSIDMTKGYVPACMRGLGDGSFRVLWYNSLLIAKKGTIGIEERLCRASEERAAVTIRGSAFSPWLKRQASRFNCTNATWKIILEEFDGSNAVDLEEYARLTSVQIATGGGPDMLYGDFMEEYIYGMTEKGALTDLAPLLAEAGIRQEDYFPFVFDVWRDDGHVYGIIPQVDSSYLYTIDAAALGGTGEPDIDALADALLAWEEDAAFDVYINPESILRWFLQGSDNLWGMIDREEGKCDFSGELFAKLLEAAKRYGNANARSYHNLVRVTSLKDFYQYDSRAELAAAGRTVCGILFDDGCHGTVASGYTLAVNASSKSQEGAVEFLSFLLGEQAQAQAYAFPVKKNLLTAWVEEQEARVIGSEDGITVNGEPYIDYGEQVRESKTYTAADITQERVTEYLTELENIRTLPFRNKPLLEIICEEAADYFNGTKSAADTAKIIENRVQLYLDEGH